MTATLVHDPVATRPQCLICGATNETEAVFCATCSAPMSLLHDSRAADREPRIVSVLGESNVGKTVYLGVLLDMLSQRAGEFEAVPRGAYSIDVQQNVISHLAARVFPPKTPMEADRWHWTYYQVCSRSRGIDWVDLVMPDMAGESLTAEVAAPQTFHVIRGLLEKSAGCLLLVDAAMAAHGSSQPDFFALKILSYLDALRAARRGGRIETPVAVLLCKSDHCPECFDDPARFARANLTRTWNLCASRFERVAFFACSVVGSLGYATDAASGVVTSVPLHTALRGVLEPFEWLVGQLQSQTGARG